MNGQEKPRERLTLERVNGIKTGYWSPKTKEELVQRLAAYENTGLMPEEIQAVRCVPWLDMDWISTAQRLPELGQRVIICRQKEKGVPYIEQATLGPGGWWKVYGTNVKQVDFWMPMPQPPEVK